MTSREEISLKLTIANIEKIEYLSKKDANAQTISTLANDVKEFYNYLYDNIKTSDTNPVIV